MRSWDVTRRCQAESGILLLVCAASECLGGMSCALRGHGLEPGSRRAAGVGEGHGAMEAGCAEAEGLQSLARHPGLKVFSTLVSCVGSLSVFSNPQFPNPASHIVLRMKAVHVRKAKFGTLRSKE